MKILSIVLKLYALVFWYITFILTLALISTRLGYSFLNFTIRQGEYRWDYEIMLASIYLVWGLYLWKSAKSPQAYLPFISFTIWANIAHAIVMTLVGVFRPGDFSHLLTDSLVLFMPAVTLLYLKRKINIEIPSKT